MYGNLNFEKEVVSFDREMCEETLRCLDIDLYNAAHMSGLVLKVKCQREKKTPEEVMSSEMEFLRVRVRLVEERLKSLNNTP